MTTQTLKTGLVKLPGATPVSTALVERLLHKDITEHHCFLNDDYFHNHLAHHILTLHDLGAPAECIQQAYDAEAANQRPLHPNGVPPAPNAQVDMITKDNWTTYLGETKCYPDYLAFFSVEVATYGVPSALEQYIFSPAANENGNMMLARFVGGLLHPMIQTGFGVEFGQDALVADGLALTALTSPEYVLVADPSGLPEIKSGSNSATLLSLLREVYDSPDLSPMPYRKELVRADHWTTWIASQPSLGPTISKIYSKWTFSLSENDTEIEIERKTEECMWLATLLLGTTNIKPNKKPRMDFFFMHFLTGTLLRGVLHAIEKPLYKAQLLQMYARSAALFVLLCGRPQINAASVMSYPAYPAPSKSTNAPAAFGSPWLALLNNAAAHPEAHAVKAIRTLFYCAQHYGTTPAGAVPGALDEVGNETHKGAAGLDGTLFVRVAGAVTAAVGWVAHGEEAGFWDIRGGWEEA
ncbi:hypothetical protein C8R45DRAFT_912241 [Mycena sanguinolenta]|nr:hypothetical protein C8R45DRAFT_912241 [Mycena sanguinolenta]